MSVADQVSLREHFESRCNERTKQYEIHVQRLEERVHALEKLVADKFFHNERMVSTVAATMEKRLEGMNEFRDALRDQAGKFITRDELNSSEKSVDSEFHSMHERLEKTVTRDELTNIAKSVEADLRVLRGFQASLENKASQYAVNAALVFSAVGVLIGIMNIVARLAGK